MRRYSCEQFGALIAAASKSNDEFENDVKPIGNKMVQAALADQRAANDKEVKQQILAAMSLVSQHRDTYVTQIRLLRKAVENTKAVLNRLDRAEKHGLLTGDFRPVLHVLGTRIEGFDGTQWDV
jgi:hypothetical protein